MGDTLVALERFAGLTALVDGARHVTYGELIDRADRLASALPPRSLVFLQAANTVEAIAAYLGALRADHVVHLVGETDEGRLGRLLALFRPNALIRSSAGGVDVEHLSGAAAPMHPDLRVLLSTSGSTGSPKLVKLSARNLESNALAIAEYLGITAADRAITSLTFNYSYGLSVLHSHWAAGASLALTEASVVDPAFWATFAQSGATSLAGVPYTFELLARNEAWAASPSLRYVTQAGGRMAPELARRLAGLGARHGWDLYIMYGQTEASPRIAYLPPKLASTHADCIGVAIPGGRISLIAEDGSAVGADETPGELRYEGPNVMMGYAEEPAALALDETPPALLTGDIALRTAEGLYRIVGRVSRIVKPFGVRINLDEVQAIARATLPDAVCAGSDARLVIAATQAPPVKFVDELAASLGLPAYLVQALQLDEIPRLANGKVDHQSLLRLSEAADDGVSGQAGSAPGEEAGFLGRFVLEMRNILGLSAQQWASVRDIYAALLNRPDVNGASSFAALAGDSLTYVQITLALEEYLGHAPEGWEGQTIDELERARDEQTAF